MQVAAGPDPLGQQWNEAAQERGDAAVVDKGRGTGEPCCPGVAASQASLKPRQTGLTLSCCLTEQCEGCGKNLSGSFPLSWEL